MVDHKHFCQIVNVGPPRNVKKNSPQKQVQSEIVAPVSEFQAAGPQLRKRKRHEASKLDDADKAELFMKVQAPKRQRLAVKDLGAVQPQDENSDALD